MGIIDIVGGCGIEEKSNVMLKDLEGLNNFIWCYYNNGEGFIILDRKEKFVQKIKLEGLEIPEQAEYVMCTGHIPDKTVRENLENPMLDISSVAFLLKKDLVKLSEMGGRRLSENKELEYESPATYFRFRKSEKPRSTFYFDIYDKTKNNIKGVGVGVQFVFDAGKLNNFYSFLNNFIENN